MYVSKQEMGVDRGQYIPDPKFSGRPGALSQFYAPKIDGSGGISYILPGPWFSLYGPGPYKLSYVQI